MKGIINLNKPLGITSFKAVSEVKKILNQKQAGHMGTLDPMADGVLIIGIGKAARLFDYFLKKDKRYVAEFTFGASTDTLDAEGKILQTTDYIPDIKQIINTLKDFQGEISQIPPLYSAKHINGKRAYELARQGIEAELKPSTVTVHSIKMLESLKKTFTFEIDCSAGTYIRSLARDIAQNCGSLAYMSKLTRIRSGKYDIKDSVTLEELSSVKQNALQSVEDALKELYRFDLDDSYYNDLINGRKIKINQEVPTDFALYCKQELFGIAYSDNEHIKIKTYLRG